MTIQRPYLTASDMSPLQPCFPSRSLSAPYSVLIMQLSNTRRPSSGPIIGYPSSLALDRCIYPAHSRLLHRHALTCVVTGSSDLYPPILVAAVAVVSVKVCLDAAAGHDWEGRVLIPGGSTGQPYKSLRSFSSHDLSCWPGMCGHFGTAQWVFVVLIVVRGLSPGLVHPRLSCGFHSAKSFPSPGHIGVPIRDVQGKHLNASAYSLLLLYPNA